MPASQDKVLVIGNGPTVVDKLSCDIIDEYDVIVRINRGYFEGIEKYSDIVGTKTDMLYIHDGFCNDEWFKKRSVDDVKVYVVIPNFKYNQHVSISSQYPFFKFVPRSVEGHLKKNWNFESKWPTTGLECLVHLTGFYKDITIVGFDNNTPEGQKYTNYHFYKHTDKRTMDDMKKPRPDHVFELERVIVDKMIREGSLKVL